MVLVLLLGATKGEDEEEEASSRIRTGHYRDRERAGKCTF